MMRPSLLPPIPELELAAKLLDAAADAVLANRRELAALLIAAADLPEIGVYARRLVGKMSVEVHRVVKRPECLPKGDRDPARMPSLAAQAAIFVRDGWRCRFCGTKVINRSARARLIRSFPDEVHWSAREFERHTALYAMACSLDHVHPHGRGGRNEPDNFVTACYCCQFGRGEWLLAEVELTDPRSPEPVRDSWDGLSRIAAAQT
ncbi:HNH endonuclease [Frateuria edaphi]|uniref:HNH endonuclease n=1 Tax=Frateuria edaphi TaxID=2898793 RepID=UPI003CE56898